MKVRLYVWAYPALIQGSPADHTWVTTYDLRKTPYASVADITAAGQHMWYCWGSFHATGTLLGSKAGSLPIARCLVEADADSQSVQAARGTIFNYGFDGVCHQLTNQVLWSTGTAPLTAKGARWYKFSTFLYGTYGLQATAWAGKIAGCSVAAGAVAKASPMAKSKSTTTIPSAVIPKNDAFARHARTTLGPASAGKVEELLKLRAQVQNDPMAARLKPMGLADTSPEAAAAALNARNLTIMQQAATILGKEGFTKVFGFSPDEAVNLVDPAQMGTNKPATL